MSITDPNATSGFSPVEDERIAALHDYAILDTPAEQGFDDVVTLATQICETPVALVSLVDRDRQWFKARVGFEPCETPIGQSVCAHALDQSDLLVIPDLTKDARTRTNTLVTGEPFLRFYAGAPLVTPAGYVLGTLCVIDPMPRPNGLTTTQAEGLRALARQVMAQLELRRTLADREKVIDSRRAEQERSRQVLDSATEFGIIALDRDGIVTDWNKGAHNIFGWTEDEMRGCRADRFFTPEDRAASRPDIEMSGALQDGRAVDERWHLRKDGSRFWASGDMMPLRDASNRHTGFVKILRDRTSEHLAGRRLELAEVRLRQAQEAGGVGVFSVDIASGMLSATSEFSRIYGLAQMPERPAQDFEALVVPEDRELVSSNSTRRAGRAPKDVEYRIRRPDNGEVRWIARKGEFRLSVEGQPIQFLGVARDVTDRVAIETKLRESEEKWRSLFEQLNEGFIVGRVLRDEAGRIVDWRYEEVNKAWHELTGVPCGTAVGRTIRQLFPDIEDVWVDEMADVVETAKPATFTRQVGALGRWYEGTVQPIGNDRFTVIFLEVTERVLAEKRRNALLDLTDALFSQVEEDALSRTAAALIGKALDVGRVGYGALSDDGRTFNVPEDWTAPGFPSLAGTYLMDEYGGYGADLRRGDTVVIPDIRFDPRTSGDTEPLESLAVRTLINHPIVENGRTVAILYVNDDAPRNWTPDEIAFVQEAAAKTRAATERRRVENALRESEERRRLATEMGDVGVLDLDLSKGTLLLDDRARAAFGIEPGHKVEKETKLAAVHPDDRAEFDRQFAEAASGGDFNLRFRTIGIDDGILRWVAVKAQVVAKADGSRRFIGATRDVTEDVGLEEQRQILNAELAHRLKNTLAMVQAIASQTLRQVTERGAVEAFTQRIHALSNAHNVLLQETWASAKILDIVSAVLTTFDGSERFDVSGPNIELGPRTVLSLSLLLHELGTNAAKYGAISSPDGRVELSWWLDNEGDDGDFVMHWKESGGPPACEPTGRGFGSRLIRMGLIGTGGVELRYETSGFEAEMRASLSQLQHS